MSGVIDFQIQFKILTHSNFIPRCLYLPVTSVFFSTPSPHLLDLLIVYLLLAHAAIQIFLSVLHRDVTRLVRFISSR